MMRSFPPHVRTRPCIYVYFAYEDTSWAGQLACITTAILYQIASQSEAMVHSNITHRYIQGPILLGYASVITIGGQV